MAKLTGQTIAASYDQLLIVGDADGITATAQAVESADTGGNASLLYLSTTEVYNPGTGGTSNTAFGKNAGDALDSGGNYNVFLGEEAGSAMATGLRNIAIGYGALDAADAGEDDNIAIGNNALGNLNNASSIENIAIGSGAGDGMGTLGSNYCIFIGTDTGGGTWTTAASNANTGIGHYVMDAAMNDAVHNTAVGYASLSALTTGDGNVVMGSEALKSITTGSNNVAIGRSALDAADGTESENIAIGYNAIGALNSDGSERNIAIGVEAQASMNHADCDHNIAIGYSAMTGGTGDLNKSIAIGGNAMNSTAGNGSAGQVAIGYASLTALADGGANTAVGYLSGTAINSGGNNTLIGYSAGDVLTAGDYCTIIGAASDPDDANSQNVTTLGYGVTGYGANNSVTLGNADVTAIYAASDGDAVVYCGGINMSLNQPAAASGSMTAELLSHYEEGSWTPTLLGASGNPTQTYAGGGQVGAYVKIGRFVFCHGRIVMGSGITVGSGVARIGGLPFTAKSLAGTYGSVNISYGNNWGTTGGCPTTGYVEPNTVYCDLQVYDNDAGNVDGTAGANAADVDDGTDLIFGIVYAT
jgi:hypothetical protein